MEEREPWGWSRKRPGESASLGLVFFFFASEGVGQSVVEGGGGYHWGWSRNFSLPFSIPAFTALADNHISHNSSLGYLGAVESRSATLLLLRFPPALLSYPQAHAG